MTDRPLSRMQRLFVASYLELWNASKAAGVAGYKWPDKQSGWLMRQPGIKAAIDVELKDVAMPAPEVIARLTQQARVNMGDFLHDDGSLNMKMIKSHGYLIKKLSYNKQGKPIIELVDSQKALELLGRHHKLFTDAVSIDLNAAVKGYVGISPDDWDEP